ncbi:MAG: glutamine synthetase [Alphaproteobacteria bacterium]|nr:glutamine synthetase [Alphaproteobacteria bacterium]
MDGWIQTQKVTEVECMIADLAGIARGKILPSEKFLAGHKERTLRLPEAVFVQTVSGTYPEEDDLDHRVSDPANIDVVMVPDAETIRLVPWYEEPTAQVICDCYYADGRELDFAARSVLRRVLKLYDDKGWKPLVAPELEFFLVRVNTDPDYPLEPPVGSSGRAETGRQAFGIDAVNEFDPLFEDIYDHCEAQGLDIDTLSHEAGAAQMEINFNHGDPLELADQAFLFKRTVRQTALRHNIYATFMAKPMSQEPGSSMHIHQSVVDAKTGQNLFATKSGADSKLFRSHVAGLQKYLPQSMPLFAPNVNSYRRLLRYSDAPINVHWGLDNRTVGLRVPVSGPKARRIENRIAGADVNPYLAIAGSLACGYIGMVDKLDPREPVEGSAYRLAHTLPRHLFDALRRFNACKPLRDLLGTRFVDTIDLVKSAELDAYQEVISSWEREHLLLNV